MNDLSGSVVTVILAIVGVALIAVLVSRNANTSGVIAAGSSGISSLISAATGPVSSSGFTGNIPNLSSSLG